MGKIFDFTSPQSTANWLWKCNGSSPGWNITKISYKNMTSRSKKSRRTSEIGSWIWGLCIPHSQLWTRRWPCMAIWSRNSDREETRILTTPSQLFTRVPMGGRSNTPIWDITTKSPITSKIILINKVYIISHKMIKIKDKIPLL